MCFYAVLCLPLEATKKESHDNVCVKVHRSEAVPASEATMCHDARSLLCLPANLSTELIAFTVLKPLNLGYNY